MESHQNTNTLADPVRLETIDKLFEFNIGEYVALPQILVVGDQSSGKSSVLEGLTQLPFPRDSGLCTRFATKITFRRAQEQRIAVSIIPSENATAEHAENLRGWKKDDLGSLDAQKFSGILREVYPLMGLEGSGGDAKTFSDDVLQIDIQGPSQQHFSVIDVPGIFKNNTSGLTTKSDMVMVKNMVSGYMKNPRAAILAIIPANVDIATQEILEIAKEHDPRGQRTFGVLTKPDLVDKGAEKHVMDIIEGKNHRLGLGWCIVRNLGQKESLSSDSNRHELEKRFFVDQEPWARLDKNSVGIEALQTRLKETLADIVRREFPGQENTGPTDVAGAVGDNQKSEVEFSSQRYKNYPDELNDLLDMKYGVKVLKGNNILPWLRTMYQSSRGFELGSFDAALVPRIWRKLSADWDALALGYISDVITLVHRFTLGLLEGICAEESVVNGLTSALMEALMTRYRKAIDHVKFILQVERDGTPLTLNHYFSANLEECREMRINSVLQSDTTDRYGKKAVTVDAVYEQIYMSNEDHVVHDLHDILKSYYQVARKRFVDVVCMQAADFYLVAGPDTPTKVFSLSFVADLSPEQLQKIAGETPITQRKRADLKREIKNLEEGKKILI